MGANLSIKRVFKQTYTALLWIFIGISLLLALTFLLLQTPIVKEFLAQKVVEEISQRSDHRIELGQVHISWLDQFVASEVHLHDRLDSTMVKAEEIEVNFDLFGLFKGQTLFFDDIVVQGAEVNLVRYPGARSINLKEFLDTLIRKKDSTSAKPLQEVRIGNIELVETKFLNRNMNVDERGDGKFDFNNLGLEIDEMIVHNLSLKGSTLEASILTLVADHATTDLRVEDLAAHLFLDNQHLTLAQLDLQTANSHITDSVALSFNHFGNLAYFSDSVHLDLRLRDSELSLLDIGHFAKVPVLDTTIVIDLDASGALSRLTLPKFSIGISSGSYLAGSGLLFGLPNTEATFADLQITTSRIQGQDIQRFTGELDFENGVTFYGGFVGFGRDFVANMDFQTDYGIIDSDLNVKIPGTFKEAVYSGGIELTGFDLGRVVDDPMIGTISLTGQVNGAGITKENVDLDMDVSISHLLYNDYDYDSLHAKGRLKDHFFDGTFEVFDPNCRIGGRADIELLGEAKLDVDLKFDTLHLQELNFAKEQLDLGGSITGEVHDLDIDDAAGKLTIGNLEITNGKSRESVPYLELEARAIEDRKSYTISSPELEAKLEGRFMPSALLKDLPAIMESYFLLLTTDRDDLEEKELLISHDTTTNYSLRLEMELMDVNPLFDLLGFDVHVSENAKMEAEFSRRKNINLSLFCDVDSLQIGPDVFSANTLEVNASRDLASTDVLALIQLSSQRQNWERTAPSENLFVESVWFNNTISSQMKLRQPSLDNRLVLNSEVTYLRDSILFKILPSDVVVNSNTWRFDRDNYVSWVDDQIRLHDLEVRSADQQLFVAGQYSLDTLSSLQFGIENFDLANLDPIMKKKLEGRLSLKGRMAQIGSEDLEVDGDISIVGLAVEGLAAGDVKGETSYDSDLDQLFIDLNLAREGVNTIDLTGYVYPAEDYDQIDVAVTFDQANIDLVQPFLSESFSDLAGTVSGQIQVGGPIDGPTFFGNGNIKDGRIKLNYTNTSYVLNGPLSFDSYEIAFRGLDIRDDLNGRGKLYGSIYHTNLTELQVDFSLALQNLRLLNTSSKDNDLYYGRAFGTGTIRVSGVTSSLTLGGELTTEGNTRVFFPLESTSNALQEDYILFVDPTKQVEETVVSRPLRDAGVTVDLALTITPDTYAELIFDAQKGDIIRGRAQGALQVKLSQSGEFSLLGGLEIQSGAYNFTVPGINKEFEIRRGGTISWSGDPYEGQIDLQAVYRQAASLNDWDPVIENTAKIPFLVVLDLEGEMMQPDIRFSIEADELAARSGGGTDALQRFLLTVNGREEELNRQVFSLLMLRKLSPQNSFQFAEVGRGISSSVSEILSNQLSYWLSQSDENLEVDIDLTGLDQEAFNTFQYRLAYSFFDGRLKVTGGNSLEGTAANGTDTELTTNNALFGNWSVEYLISADGRLRVKVFSRVNPALSGTTDTYQETGASFQYIHSFNQFKQLISRPNSELNDRATQPVPQGTPGPPDVSLDF